jgi:hypothetical protein
MTDASTEAPMSDAPETIWACYDPQDKTTYWAAPDNPYAEGDLVGVYRRADLPLTDAQLMADPRVKALVDVLEWALRYQPKDDSCESWVSDARLALAAIPAQGGET